MSFPAVSVVIPHKDDLGGLARTLSALAGQDGGAPFEVVVVDNGSACGMGQVADVAAPFQRLDLRLVQEAEPGAGPARNLGASLARAPALAFLDCDCRPASDWVAGIDELLRSETVVGGPVWVEAAGDPVPFTPAAAFDLLYGFNVPRSFARDGLLLTANLAVRRSVFDAVGPFRTGLSEDRDWCERARRDGVRLVLSPMLAVAHAAVADQRRLEERWARLTRESFAFYRAYGRSDLEWALYCLLTLCSPLAHGPRVFMDRRLAGASLAFRLRVLALLASIRLRRGLQGLGLLLTGQERA